MNEVRQLLRYVLPGLVYVVLTILMMLIIFPEWALERLAYFASKDSLGATLGSILAIGALGYLFATIHHWLHWREWRNSFGKWLSGQGVLDHSGLIKRLREKHLISQADTTTATAAPGAANPPSATTTPTIRLEAEEFSFALWYERLDKPPIQEADKKLSALGDSTRGLGAAAVACFSAAATALWICLTAGKFSFEFESILRFVLAFAIGLLSAILFQDAYQRTGKRSQQIYDSILERALEKEDLEKKAAATQQGNHTPAAISSPQ